LTSSGFIIKIELAQAESKVEDCIMPESSEIRRIRTILTTFFSDEDLSDLCLDHFPEVHGNFTAGMTKRQKIEQLIIYCKGHDQIPDLQAAIQSSRPEQYSAWFPEKPQIDSARESELKEPRPRGAWRAIIGISAALIACVILGIIGFLAILPHISVTPTSTPTQTSTAVMTTSATPSAAPTSTPTVTPSPTFTPSPTPTRTLTRAPTRTPTRTRTRVPAPTWTPSNPTEKPAEPPSEPPSPTPPEPPSPTPPKPPSPTRASS
jgi:hypothetical protein